MDSIILKKTIIDNNMLKYDFTVSSGLRKFFRSSPYFIEYQINETPMDLCNVPLGVLAIPFVCNVLPIIWLTDSKLVLDELDGNFFKSITDFKKGYIEMYPEAEFKGKITVKNITEAKSQNSGNSASFFSGGLDAWCTFVRHISENPDLIILWGADIPYTNEKGWAKLYHNVSKTAKEYNKNLITIKTSFRMVIDDGVLSREFTSKLHDGWWHGVQHGIAIIGHAAPCDFLRGVSKQYIAASFSPEDKNVTCASYPTIDNRVRFFDCQVFHDAFVTRSQKTKEIVSYRKRTGNQVHLHVCWETVDGENCCRCEKCWRTMMGIMLENDYTKYYGFSESKTSFKQMKELLTNNFDFSQAPYLKVFWKEYKTQFIIRKKQLKNMSYYKYIKWIEKYDFDNPKMSKKPRLFKIRYRLSEMSFYKNLHKLKSRIKGL